MIGFSKRSVEEMNDNSRLPVVITIARDFGAEGHAIGRKLSERLSIPLYDNELLQRSANLSGQPLDQVAAYDERLSSETLAFLPDATDNRTASDKLFQNIAQVIQQLGERESCIIEGRLSDYILRDNPNMISVLITAPFDFRVEIVRSKRGLSVYQGKRLVKQRQRERELFYKRYSKGKWKMTTNKDLVINRQKLGIEGAVDILEAVYRTKCKQVLEA